MYRWPRAGSSDQTLLPSIGCSAQLLPAHQIPTGSKGIAQQQRAKLPTAKLLICQFFSPPGIALLSSEYPQQILPVLLARYECPAQGTEDATAAVTRMKLGEVLMRVTRALGESMALGMALPAATALLGLTNTGGKPTGHFCCQKVGRVRKPKRSWLGFASSRSRITGAASSPPSPQSAARAWRLLGSAQTRRAEG